MHIPVSQRSIGVVALVAPLWFLTVYLVMSLRRPEYSHLTKAISELGSLDAPNKWVWNILGYILTGLATALVGVGVRRMFADSRRGMVAASGVVVMGMMMALSGVFPGDFDAGTSFTMLIHTIGSLGSFVGFLLAGFALPALLRQRGETGIALLSLVLVWAAIVTGLLRSGSAPGLGQRLGFAAVLLWVAVVGIALLRDRRGGLVGEPGRVGVR